MERQRSTYDREFTKVLDLKKMKDFIEEKNGDTPPHRNLERAEEESASLFIKVAHQS